MSWIGHGGTATALVVALPPDGFAWHTHRRHQLAVDHRGVVVVAVGERAWALPPSRALWLPAGVPHAVRAESDAVLSSVYVDRWPGGAEGPTEPLVVEATPLLRELVVHLTTPGLTVEARRRAEGVLGDAVVPVAAATLAPPSPTDDRAARVAEGLRSDPADARTIEQWGAAVGASGRTLARAFVEGTGMGFARWRTHVRLGAALPLLAEGQSVADVGRRVGYATPSAFVAAFRRELGTTPARWRTEAG